MRRVLRKRRVFYFVPSYLKAPFLKRGRHFLGHFRPKFESFFVTDKTSSDQPTKSRDVNKLVLWPFRRFCFEACPWRWNGGKVDSAEQGGHCFCFRRWAAKGNKIFIAGGGCLTRESEPSRAAARSVFVRLFVVQLKRRSFNPYVEKGLNKRVWNTIQTLSRVHFLLATPWQRAWSVERRWVQVTDVLGRVASAWGVSKWSVKRARRLSWEGVYREGEDDREDEDTPQVFYKKYHYFFIFQAIFFIHTSKKLPCYDLFKNVWFTRIDWVLFILSKKPGARNFEIDYNVIMLYAVKCSLYVVGPFFCRTHHKQSEKFLDLGTRTWRGADVWVQ